MFKPVKHLAKSLYDGTWEDEPYMFFILYMILFAVVILILSIICITGNTGPPVLDYIFKQFKPKKQSNITEKSMINSYNQFLRH